MTKPRYAIEQEAPGSALYMVVDTTETRCTIAVASHCIKEHAEIFAKALNDAGRSALTASDKGEGR